jgi:transcriptional regulator with XRE-family HTH domain
VNFGEAIRHLRKQRGMTLRELARTCDVSRSCMLNVETGNRSPCSSDMAEQVYSALKLDAPQRAELEMLRIFTIGRLDISGLSEDAVRQLIAFRDELRVEEET